MNSIKLFCGASRTICCSARYILPKATRHFLYPQPSQNFVRHYAKGKDKKKEPKGNRKNLKIEEQFLSSVIDYEVYVRELQKTVDHLKGEYSRTLGLRSTVGSIESLTVSHDGKTYTIMEISQVIRKSSKSVIINMDAFPQLIPSALKSITSSGMNLNPQQDGTTLHIPIPKFSKEYRENLAKGAKQLFIKCRDSIKNIQNNLLKDIKMKENNGMSQDCCHQANEQVKMVAEKYLKIAESLMAQKQAEIMQEK